MAMTGRRRFGPDELLAGFSLVCAVTYSTVTTDKAYFRKFFKFPVAKPLDVRTKFYNAEVTYLT